MKNRTMKKQLMLIGVLSFLSFFVVAQNTEGINFEHGTWAEITAKAKKAKQLIFIDCFTEWCGPCKKLSKEVFPLKNVGEFFNANFVNYKLDMEKGEGVTLKNKFHVGAFPTLLWVDHKGNVVHRFVGYSPAEKLLEEASIALKGGSGITEIEKKYKKNKNKPEVVLEYLNYLVKNHDTRASEVAAHYLSIIPKEQYLEEENFQLIVRNLKDPFSPAIEYIYENYEVFKEKFGSKINLDDVLSRKYTTAARMLTSPVGDGSGEFDEAAFQKLIQLMEKRNVKEKDQIVEDTRLSLLELKKEWRAYVEKIESMRSSGFFKDSDEQVIAKWYYPILKNEVKDPVVVKQALKWIDESVEKHTHFSLFMLGNLWNVKINLMERLGDEYSSEVEKLKTERELLGRLTQMQNKYNAEMKKSGKSQSGGVKAIRMMR